MCRPPDWSVNLLINIIEQIWNHEKVEFWFPEKVEFWFPEKVEFWFPEKVEFWSHEIQPQDQFPI